MRWGESMTKGLGCDTRESARDAAQTQRATIALELPEQLSYCLSAIDLNPAAFSDLSIVP